MTSQILGATVEVVKNLSANNVDFCRFFSKHDHGLRLLALDTREMSTEERAARAASADFYSEHVLVVAPALATTIRYGAYATLDFPDTWNL